MSRNYPYAGQCPKCGASVQVNAAGLPRGHKSLNGCGYRARTSEAYDVAPVTATFREPIARPVDAERKRKV